MEPLLRSGWPAAADVDGDGKKDLVFGDEQLGLFVFLNAGKRQFAAPVPLGDKSNAPYSIGLADMDKDGKLDIVAGNYQAPGSVFFNRSAGAKLNFQEGKWGDGKGAVYGLAIGDLDGDGWLDIAAARSDAPNGIWFSGAR